MTETIIELKGIKKTYSSGLLRRVKTAALAGVDLSIQKGEIFGLLGPNGAGKTTLLNIIIGLLETDEGSVKIMGEDVTRRVPDRIRHKMNMCSGNPNFPWCMTVTEILKFYGLLYGLGARRSSEAAAIWIEAFELDKHADTRFDELSTGTKQRLAMAKSLLNDPAILLLDEPTIGLDPDIARKIRALIKKIHADTSMTIILTTHYMQEAEELSGRIAFIKNGSVTALGTSAQLREMTRQQNLEGVFLELASDGKSTYEND